MPGTGKNWSERHSGTQYAVLMSCSSTGAVQQLSNVPGDVHVERGQWGQRKPPKDWASGEFRLGTAVVCKCFCMGHQAVHWLRDRTRFDMQEGGLNALESVPILLCRSANVGRHWPLSHC